MKPRGSDMAKPTDLPVVWPSSMTSEHREAFEAMATAVEKYRDKPGGCVDGSCVFCYLNALPPRIYTAVVMLILGYLAEVTDGVTILQILASEN